MWQTRNLFLMPWVLSSIEHFLTDQYRIVYVLNDEWVPNFGLRVLTCPHKCPPVDNYINSPAPMQFQQWLAPCKLMGSQFSNKIQMGLSGLSSLKKISILCMTNVHDTVKYRSTWAIANFIIYNFNKMMKTQIILVCLNIHHTEKRRKLLSNSGS